MTVQRAHRTLWRNRTFLTCFFALSLLALLFLGATVWSMGQLRATRSLLRAQQALKEQQAALAADAIRLHDIDAMVVVAGEYASALAAYRRLRERSDTALVAPLDARIGALETLLAQRNNDTTDIDARGLLMGQYRQTLHDLEERTENLQRSLAQRTDSLQGRIEDLVAEMTRKEKELGRKDLVQVISFSSTKGQRIHYLGEVVNGKASGGGVGIWTTGSVYRGQWRNNLRHGEGTFEWVDGERYEGTYVDGVREGFGKYYWPSGDRYEGTWKADRRNGQGTLFDMDGNIRFKGTWKDDKPVDRGMDAQ